MTLIKWLVIARATFVSLLIAHCIYHVLLSFYYFYISKLYVSRPIYRIVYGIVYTLLLFRAVVFNVLVFLGVLAV